MTELNTELQKLDNPGKRVGEEMEYVEGCSLYGVLGFKNLWNPSGRSKIYMHKEHIADNTCRSYSLNIYAWWPMLVISGTFEAGGLEVEASLGNVEKTLSRKKLNK